jgi:hypothetical protein
MMPKYIVELGTILVHCTQPYIIKADTDKNFCISDHPVTLCNKNKFGPYGNLGFALPGIEIYMPISPKFTIAFISNTIQNYKFPSTEFLNILQMRFSDRQIIFFDDTSINLLSKYRKNSFSDFWKTDIIPAPRGYYEIIRHVFE